MEEGLLDAVVGGEEEKIDRKPVGPEPIIIAVANDPAGSHPEVAAETVAMFRKQTELLELQKKNLSAEHHFFEQQRSPRLLALRLRTGLQVFLVLFLSVIGVGLSVVIYQALQSRNVVVETFNVPPSLEQQGLNGRVVAAGLLDVLSKIQAATRSSLAHPSVVSAWYNDVTVEVPEVGISLGQLERMVKTRFGHDQHIEGDLVLVGKGGYALTVRGTGILSKTFTDESGNLDALLKQAGEYLYGQSQPGLWAWYLGDVGRSDEAISFSRNMIQSAQPAERPFILNAWGNAVLSLGASDANQSALALYREAVRLDPNYMVALYNIMETLTNLGREQEVPAVGEQLLKASGGRPGKADENLFQYWDAAAWNLQALRRGFVEDIESHGGVGSITGYNGAEGLSIVQVDALLHDAEGGNSRMLTTKFNESSAPDRASSSLARGLLAFEAGNYSEAAKQMDLMVEAFKDPVVFSVSPSSLCFAMPIYQAAGDTGKAQSTLVTIGSLTFVDCTRYEGDLLDAGGDWAAAQTWYEKAVKLAPSLPGGYYSWGRALARHGDLAAAQVKLQEANKLGPHWADPLKAWGDVLMMQKKRKDALAKYDEALKFAPNWQALKAARQSATVQTG